MKGVVWLQYYIMCVYEYVCIVCIIMYMYVYLLTFIICFILGHTGWVEWYSDSVHLSYPSPVDYEEVISKLNNNHKWIGLNFSSTHSTVVLLSSPKLYTLTLRTLEIFETPLPHDCIQYLCQLLTNNKSIQELKIWSNSISDRGVADVCKILEHNSTITSLDLSINPLITSASAQALSHLLNNSTLSELDLRETSLSSESLLLLLQSLSTNKNMKRLILDNRHKETCINTYPNYHLIQDRVEWVLINVPNIASIVYNNNNSLPLDNNRGSLSSGYVSSQSESDKERKIPPLSVSNYPPTHNNNTSLQPIQSNTEFSDSDSYRESSPARLIPGSPKAKRKGREERRPSPVLTTPLHHPHGMDPRLSDHRAPYLMNGANLHPYHASPPHKSNTIGGCYHHHTSVPGDSTSIHSSQTVRLIADSSDHSSSGSTHSIHSDGATPPHKSNTIGGRYHHHTSVPGDSTSIHSSQTVRLIADSSDHSSSGSTHSIHSDGATPPHKSNTIGGRYHHHTSVPGDSTSIHSSQTVRLIADSSDHSSSGSTHSIHSDGATPPHKSNTIGGCYHHHTSVPGDSTSIHSSQSVRLIADSSDHSSSGSTHSIHSDGATPPHKSNTIGGRYHHHTSVPGDSTSIHSSQSVRLIADSSDHSSSGSTHCIHSDNAVTTSNYYHLPNGRLGSKSSALRSSAIMISLPNESSTSTAL